MGWTMTRAIDIAAPPPKVWAVLADLASWADWNPFIIRAAGEAVPGSTLRLRMRDTRGWETTFTPKVEIADAPRELRWLGHLVVPALFEGEHRFELTATADGGTRLAQTEEFRGILAPLLRRRLERRTGPQFDAMNRALAERVTALG